MPVSAFLPPTKDDLEIAAKVNRLLPPNANVSLYRVDCGDDGPVRYGIVFQYGAHRRPREQANPFWDPEEIVKDMRAWVNACNYAEGKQWTLTPPALSPTPSDS